MTAELDMRAEWGELFGALAELVHIASAVEHRIVSMEMKMDELGHRLLIDCTWA